jgi:alkylhydroperoxidase family enzyme
MTHNPADVADTVFDELKLYFNIAQIVELTTMVGFENLRARFNRALHIEATAFASSRRTIRCVRRYRPGNRDE